MFMWQYLEMRFGRPIRIATSLAFSVQMILYMAIVLYVPALTLEAVIGMPQTASILLVGLVCVFYSTMGGIKAVIITDFFQVIRIKHTINHMKLFIRVHKIDQTRV